METVKRFKWYWSICTINLLIPLSAGLAATIHVPADFPAIQQAIDAASNGDTVLIADGLYTGALNKNLTFGDRSMTLASENGPGACIIDCENNGRAIERISETGDVWLEGLSIRNGNGLSSHGGGIYSYDSPLYLTNCVIMFCQGENGGGLYFFSNSFNPDVGIEITDCRFEHNRATGDGGGTYIRNLRDDAAIVRNCQFQSNISENEGGGLWAKDRLLLSNCSFLGNQSTDLGAVTMASGSVDLCVFEENFLHALYIENPINSALVTRCRFTRNAYGVGLDTIQGDSAHYYLNEAIIGGSSGMGNVFTDNYYSAIKSDIQVTGSIPFTIIAQAQYNNFSDYPGSRFVCETEDIDLTHCTYQTEAIQDNVYMSPTGNDGHSGLSPEEPFRSFTKASRSIKGTPAKPVTIFLAEGTYLLADNYEKIDRLNLEYITVQGAGQNNTILDGGSSKPGIGGYCLNTVVSDLSVRNTSFYATNFYGKSVTLQYVTVSESREGGAFLTLEDSVSVLHSTFENNPNNNMYRKAALSIWMQEQSLPVIISDCIVRNNRNGGITVANAHASIWNTLIENNSNDNSSIAGGLYSFFSELEMTNCLIAGNHSIDGHGAFTSLYGDLGSILLTNCTVVNNTSVSGLGTGYLVNASIQNCILSGNSTLFGKHLGMSAALDSVYQIGISASNVEGGRAGIDVDQYSEPYFDYDSSNFDDDSLFVTGPMGDFYLSQTAAGQSQNSPCVNRGPQIASDICKEWAPYICLSNMTTRTDETVDTGLVDTGYHYPNEAPYSGTPEVRLILPQIFFIPGDIFWLDLKTRSDFGNLLNVQLFVALEISGAIWFYPAWCYYGPPDFPVSYETVWIRNEIRNIIPEFTWPNISATGEGLHFYSLCMNPTLTQIVSNIDVIEWGFSY